MVQAFLERISWLGHDTFLVAGSRILYFDPYQVASGPEADLILVGHDHFDHCSPDDIERLSGPHTIVVAPRPAAKKVRGEVRIIESGDSVEINGVLVEALPAYNLNKHFHIRTAGGLGYVVTLDGVRLYHAGDTDKIPEMDQIEADIAFLPVSGTYVMTWQEAVEAARAIRPKVAIPMHYGSIVGCEEDALSFAQALKGEIEVRILPLRKMP